MSRRGAARRGCAVGLLGLALLAGCVRHVYPFTQKTRAYKPDTYAAPDAARTPGSLWSEGAHNLFEDARARRVGDILTIRVIEQADATRDSSTDTARQAAAQVGVGSFWNVMAKLAAKNPGLDPNALFGATSDNSFSGSGNTRRSGQLTAVLPVRIKDALPNGDFYVEGNKVLLLNDEESFLYISGVVRPIDIEPDNSVASTVLADVELEYTGRGVLSENQQPGWMARLLKWVWPF